MNWSEKWEVMGIFFIILKWGGSLAEENKSMEFATGTCVV